MSELDRINLELASLPRGSPPPPDLDNPAPARSPYRPTSEQEEAVSKFTQRESLKVVGYAGAAKTSTLELIAKSTPRRGIYLAFNKAITREAGRRFPRTVRPRTTHSLALTPFRHKYSEQKLFSKANVNAVVAELKLEDQTIAERHLTAQQIAARVLETIRRFCNSGSPLVLPTHVHLEGRFNTKTDPIGASAITMYVHQLALQLWPRMIDPTSPYPLGHDGYLKLWSLQDPKIAFDYILLDEAQDTNPCVIEVLKSQDAQLVFVGDPNQQIYQWRGAVDAMERIPSRLDAYLTRSFRFGDSLAREANVCLGLLGCTRKLRGSDSRETRIGNCEPNAILARTNAGAIREVLLAFDRRHIPCILGGKSELVALLRAVKALRQGVAVLVPELFGYQDWKEVVQAVNEDLEPGLRVLVDLVKTHGEDKLLEMLDRCPEEEADANITISTVHKAKGREWDRVQIADDFSAPGTIPDHQRLDFAQTLAGDTKQVLEKLDMNELKLLYVAMTRARRNLAIPLEISQFLCVFRSFSEHLWNASRRGSAATGL